MGGDTRQTNALRGELLILLLPVGPQYTREKRWRRSAKKRLDPVPNRIIHVQGQRNMIKHFSTDRAILESTCRYPKSTAVKTAVVNLRPKRARGRKSNSSLDPYSESCVAFTYPAVRNDNNMCSIVTHVFFSEKASFTPVGSEANSKIPDAMVSFYINRERATNNKGCTHPRTAMRRRDMIHKRANGFDHQTHLL